MILVISPKSKFLVRRPSLGDPLGVAFQGKVDRKSEWSRMAISDNFSQKEAEHE
jgi:hypothetical protein